MNKLGQIFRLLFAVASILFLFGCASQDMIGTQRAVVAPSTQMTLRQAQVAMTEALKHQVALKKVREIEFGRHKVTFMADFEYLQGSYLFDGMTHKCTVFFDGKILTHQVETPKLNGVAVNHVDGIHVAGRSEQDAAAQFETESDADTFIAASHVLETAAVTDTEAADFTAFSASAKIWLETSPKPEMTDEVRGYKVLAEDAYTRKDFAAALDAYEKALDHFPMWPSGHYNAAVLAAEAGDYDSAAKHMRRYLVLSPEAIDARAAKDKLLLWQLKAKNDH